MIVSGNCSNCEVSNREAHRSSWWLVFRPHSEPGTKPAIYFLLSNVILEASIAKCCPNLPLERTSPSYSFWNRISLSTARQTWSANCGRSFLRAKADVFDCDEHSRYYIFFCVSAFWFVSHAATGVNLPAHLVVIKGTSTYVQGTGYRCCVPVVLAIIISTFRDMDPLDVIQIAGFSFAGFLWNNQNQEEPEGRNLTNSERVSSWQNNRKLLISNTQFKVANKSSQGNLTES